MNILVVDDDEDTTTLLALILEREGWHVDTAGSLVEARRAFREAAYCVLVADLHLPDGSGLSLLEGGRPATLQGAILVTGACDEAQRNESITLGFDRCLTKPIGADEIVANIRGVTGTA